MNLTDNQLAFLKSLPYLDGYEIKDLVKGFTTLDVLLDPDDLDLFNEIKD